MGVLDDAIREHLELKRQHGASDEELTRAEQDALGPARRDQIEEADPQAMAEPALVPDHIEPLPHGDPLADHEPPVAEDAYAPPTEFLPPEEGHDDGMEPEFAPIDGQTEIGEEGAMLAGEPIADFEAAPEAPPEHAATEIHEPEPQLDDNTAAHQGDPMAHDAAPPAHEPAPAEYEEHELEHEEEPAPVGQYATEEHELEPHEDEEHHEPPPPPPAEERNERDDLLEDTPDFLQETPEHDRLWFEQKPPRDFDFDE